MTERGPMQLNRNSWHYRLYSFYNNKTPNNLCQYMWRLLGHSAFWGTILMLCLWSLYMFFFVYDCSIPPGDDSKVVFMVGGLVAVGGILFFAIVVPVSYLVYKIYNSTFLREWMRAIKEKYCPLVQVVDETEKKK